MKMIEAGYSINYIHTHFGISHGLLESLWLQYQIEGESSLIKKKNIKADGDYRERVVRDIEEKHITLQEAAVKYDVSVARICAWKKIVKEQGYDGELPWPDEERIAKFAGVGLYRSVQEGSPEIHPVLQQR